jgi:hypothetical protein
MRCRAARDVTAQTLQRTYTTTTFASSLFQLRAHLQLHLHNNIAWLSARKLRSLLRFRHLHLLSQFLLLLPHCPRLAPHCCAAKFLFKLKNNCCAVRLAFSMSSPRKKLSMAKAPIPGGRGKLSAELFAYAKSRSGRDEVIAWSKYLFPFCACRKFFS